MEQEKKSPANRLIDESSPYLLQHARNPVDWRPWGDEAFSVAQEQDMLVLVSIGYSACHWCHVMERESFENPEIAKLMNRDYICIKVDREERPDVDQVYMDAVQLMTGRGGWPLNIFVLPDRRPVYGGTYFPPQQWASVLQQLASGFKEKRPKYLEYAEKLAAGVRQMHIVEPAQSSGKADTNRSHNIFLSLQKQFDTEEGGMLGAPKFPMPAISEFLLCYYSRTGNKDALKHVELTLEKMARGGIYDQVGGGFARYSTDAAWKVPHFEKMLYDNGQLLSLYAHAFQATRNPLFQRVVQQTVDFTERGMTAPEGGFYAALDADSEGVEGKFYLWQKDELQAVLAEDAEWVAEWYGTGKEGRWEGSNILLVKQDAHKMAKNLQWPEEKFWQKLAEANEKLLEAREKRIRPGLDDKILTGWNALMLTGLLDAYLAFGEPKYLQLARNNLVFLEEHVWKDEVLYRNYKNGKATIPAFLEDYALLIQALLRYYAVTFEAHYLEFAQELTEKVLSRFADRASPYFLFAPARQQELFANKAELNDNVIPSSNSVMAENLFQLSLIFDNEKWNSMAKEMMAGLMEQMQQNGRFFANWARLATLMHEPFFEIAITGEQAVEIRLKLESQFLPQKSVMGSTKKNDDIPLLKGKFADGQTLIYVCVAKTCNQPVTEPGEAIEQINSILKNAKY